MFVKCAKCDFKKHTLLVSCFNAVLCPFVYEKIVSRFGIALFSTYRYGAAPCDNMPKLLALSMSLEAQGLMRIDRDYFYRRLLVERKALIHTPRALIFFIMSNIFHSLNYTIE